MAQLQQPNETHEFEQEYQQIKSDVKKVIITNALIIALLVALYVVNQKTDWLAELLGKYF